MHGSSIEVSENEAIEATIHQLLYLSTWLQILRSSAETEGTGPVSKLAINGQKSRNSRWVFQMLFRCVESTNYPLVN